MAVSRATKATAATNSTVSNSGIPGAPLRVSFAKIREPLGTPNLLDLQIQSFQWFTGDEAWFQRKCPSNVDTLPLPSGQFMGIPSGKSAGLQTDAVQQIMRPRDCLP